MRKQRGSIYVELAVSIPFMILIVMGSIEITRILEAGQIMNNASRTAANLIHRECYYAGTPADVQPCADGRYNMSVFDNYAATRLPGMEMRISVYDYNADMDSTTNDVVLIAERKSAGFDSAGYQSRYADALDPSVFGLTVLDPTRTRVVIAEVFYNYTRTLDIARRLKIISAPSLYESTIF